MKLLANRINEPGIITPKITAVDFSEPVEKTTTESLFQKGYNEDSFPAKILKLLEEGARHCKEISLAKCENRDGQLYYRDKLYVPDLHELKMCLCQEHRDSIVAGHPRRA